MTILKTIIILIVVFILWLLWGKFTTNLFSSEDAYYPILRARLGTVLHHSSDDGGVEHTYCYYPKAEANSKIVLKRQDNGDCSKWYGKIILTEGDWVSEKEKFWWSRQQHISDCGNCDDL